MGFFNDHGESGPWFNFSYEGEVLDSLSVLSDFSLCLSPYVLLFVLPFDCGFPLNKYCIWILKLRVSAVRDTLTAR